MSIAYSYIRFSSIQQAQGDSLRRQTQLAQEYCHKHNLTLSETNYQDLGVSAFHSANTQEDNGLGQFLAALEQGVISEGSYLLVESFDRLSRDEVLVALNQMLIIIKYGIKIVTLMDDKVYDNTAKSPDLMFSLILMERAHEESKIKSERVRAAWDNKRQNPYTTNRHSTTPFWLKLNEDKRTYTVIEERAEIIKTIFQLSIDGWGITKIARYLTAQGISAPKGGSWATTTIGRVLNSKAVLGIYQPNRNRKSMNAPIENYFPAIIDEDTYYLSQKHKSERSIPQAAGRKTEFPNPLNQIAKCKNCGSSMGYDNKSSTLKYLTCREYKKKNCTNTPIRIELIYRFIFEVFCTPMYHKNHAELVDTSPNNDKTQSKFTTVETKLNEEQEALRELLRLSSDFSNEIIQGEIKTRSERIQSLENELELIKEELALEQTNAPLINFKEALQLTVDALQIPFNGIEPKPLTSDDLFTVRVRLNRTLKQAFNHVHIYHDKESQSIEIETQHYKYKTTKAAIKKPMDTSIWSMG
ncbi:recombinase family protein [Photobacterium leiognathi]|uniref:recombinase family protein n=1 Tax=Photobacterium leiognathi TaxID=553611 RepID=UPI002981FFC7|nr:recombinase family protein [Photobacterium leiognathi]